MKQKIESYIFEDCHIGEIALLWFDNDKVRSCFFEDILNRTISDKYHSEVKPAQKNQPKEARQIRKFVCKSQGASESRNIYVISDIEALDWICQWVLSLEQSEKYSVFIVDDRISPTFFTDKVICVDHEGRIEDEFYV